MTEPTRRGDHELHPTWGVVSLHQRSGYAKLFRSATRAHSYIAIRVSTARKQTKDGKDEPLIMNDETIVEIGLSPVQFAELLTTGNLNAGVPCTILRRGRESMGDPPHEDDEIQECADDAAGKAVAEAPPLIKQAVAILVEEGQRAGGFRKSTVAQAIELLNRAHTRATLDADFWREEISKRASAVRMKAAADFQATIDLFLRRAGLDALKERVARYLPTLEARELPSPDEDTDR